MLLLRRIIDILIPIKNLKFFPKKNIVYKTQDVTKYCAFFLLCVLFCTACESKPPLVKNKTRHVNDGYSSIEMEGVRFTQTEGGKTLWHLTAVKANLFEEKGYVLLQKIGVKFIEGENREVNVESDIGRLDIEKKDFTLEGNIVAKSSDGITFKTESLYWNEDKKLMETSTSVEVVSGNMHIRGDSLKANSSLEMVWIKGNVETVIENL